MNQALRIGVVGCGSMGANHARIASDVPGFSLIGVVDHREERRRAVSDAVGCTPFETIDDLLAAGIDAAIVATPTANHHEAGVRLLDSGTHVLLEKPIAATAEEGRNLVAAAERAGRVLTIGHVERFNPAVMALKKAVAPEDVRQIQIVRAGPFPARIGDVGIVLDLGVHDIDLIRWIAGSEIETTGVALSRTHGVHEDAAFLQFRAASGAIASIATNWLTPYRRRVLEVATRDRFYVCDLLLRTVTEFSDYGPDGSARQRQLFVAQAEPLKLEHLSFHAAIRGEAAPGVSAEDGLRSLELALHCLGR